MSPAASTQNRALSALLFLYREVLKQGVALALNSVRAQKPRRLPTVLTREEVQKVIGSMKRTHQLMTKLHYGSGFRLMECVRLRVKDIDFGHRQIVVRDGKGMTDLVTMLPSSLIEPLQEHLFRLKHLHEGDLAEGYGSVYLPFALGRKYPNAGRVRVLQYVFTSDTL